MPPHLMTHPYYGGEFHPALAAAALIVVAIFFITRKHWM